MEYHLKTKLYHRNIQNLCTVSTYTRLHCLYCRGGNNHVIFGTPVWTSSVARLIQREVWLRQLGLEAALQ